MLLEIQLTGVGIQLTGLTSSHALSVPNHFQRHMSWSFLCSFNKLRWEVIVRFVKIDWIANYHWVNFLFIPNRSYLVKSHSDSTKKFSEIDMLKFLIDNIFVIFGRRVFQLCSSSRRIVPLFVWGRFHTGASQEKQKEASPIL